jgi:hypothetical protein
LDPLGSGLLSCHFLRCPMHFHAEPHALVLLRDLDDLQDVVGLWVAVILPLYPRLLIQGPRQGPENSQQERQLEQPP